MKLTNNNRHGIIPLHSITVTKYDYGTFIRVQILIMIYRVCINYEKTLLNIIIVQEMNNMSAISIYVRFTMLNAIINKTWSKFNI